MHHIWFSVYPPSESALVWIIVGVLAVAAVSVVCGRAALKNSRGNLKPGEKSRSDDLAEQFRT
jgi:hypothetical protein